MWFRIDDTFYDHPKAIGMSNDSLATWMRAGGWCARQLTDGLFPDEMVEQFAGDAADPAAVVRDLVRRRLWEPVELDHHHRFHDWTQWNRSREQVLAQRKKTTDRVARWRAERNAVGDDVTDSTPVTNAVTGPRNAVQEAGNGVGNAAPDPTRPDPPLKGGGEGARLERDSPDETWVRGQPAPSGAGRAHARSKHQTPPAVPPRRVVPDEIAKGGAGEARRLLAEKAEKDAANTEARQGPPEESGDPDIPF